MTIAGRSGGVVLAVAVTGRRPQRRYPVRPIRVVVPLPPAARRYRRAHRRAEITSMGTAGDRGSRPARHSDRKCARGAARPRLHAALCDSRREHVPLSAACPTIPSGTSSPIGPVAQSSMCSPCTRPCPSSRGSTRCHGEVEARTGQRCIGGIGTITHLTVSFISHVMIDAARALQRRAGCSLRSAAGADVDRSLTFLPTSAAAWCGDRSPSPKRASDLPTCRPLAELICRVFRSLHDGDLRRSGIASRDVIAQCRVEPHAAHPDVCVT